MNNKSNLSNFNNVSTDKSFLLEESIDTLLKRLNEGGFKDKVERNNLILNLIRVTYPISIYEVAKKSNISYPTIKQVVKELEFCGLIHTKICTGENGMPVKLIYINLEENQNE